MEYKVIPAGGKSFAEAAKVLGERVTQELSGGWKLSGGVSMTVETEAGSPAFFYWTAQALTKG